MLDTGLVLNVSGSSVKINLQAPPADNTYETYVKNVFEK